MATKRKTNPKELTFPTDGNATIKEAAAFLGYSAFQVWRWCKAGRIECNQPGGEGSKYTIPWQTLRGMAKKTTA